VLLVPLFFSDYLKYVLLYSLRFTLLVCSIIMQRLHESLYPLCGLSVLKDDPLFKAFFARAQEYQRTTEPLHSWCNLKELIGVLLMFYFSSG